MPQIRMIPDGETSLQLSDLLGHLSSDERAELLDRRLGPNAVTLDTRALTEQLANPTGTRVALGQINQGQLLLLHWLPARPGLRASWHELTDALGDRLTPELRDGYLQDLRLWG